MVGSSFLSSVLSVLEAKHSVCSAIPFPYLLEEVSLLDNQYLMLMWVMVAGGRESFKAILLFSPSPDYSITLFPSELLP